MQTLFFDQDFFYIEFVFIIIFIKNFLIFVNKFVFI